MAEAPAAGDSVLQGLLARIGTLENSLKGAEVVVNAQNAKLAEMDTAIKRAELEKAAAVAATDEATSFARTRNSIVDTRLVARPQDFNGDQHAWANWSFVFRSYAAACDSNLESLMEAA